MPKTILTILSSSALFEAIAIRIYGVDRFCGDIESMIGFRPNIYWRICWKYISPIFLLGVVSSALYSSEGLTFHDYVFPEWATALGWVLSLSSVAAIPVMAATYWIQKWLTRDRTDVSSPKDFKRNSIQVGPQFNSGVFV